MTFHYRFATFADLDQRAVDKLVFGGGEGQFILKAHLFVERLLDTAIQQSLRYPDRLYTRNRLSFELKIDLARSLDVLPERMVSAIRALHGLRNKVVHADDFKPSLVELRRLRLDWEPIQAEAFEAAMAKGLEEAERIACLFLAWRCIDLVAESPEPTQPKRRRAHHG